MDYPDYEDMFRFRTALVEIWRIVHTPTARTEPALHHFQRDFDRIRQLIEAEFNPRAFMADQEVAGPNGQM